MNELINKGLMIKKAQNFTNQVVHGKIPEYTAVLTTTTEIVKMKR
jgi:hypothetical protein